MKAESLNFSDLSTKKESDDKSALVKAAKTAFTNTIPLFYMIHTKDGVRHQLTSIDTSTSVH